MRRLHAAGFVDALEREVRGNGRPFIGLCLGMQLLATEGHEHGVQAGLGWLKGTVRRIAAQQDGVKLRIPHVGWNDLEIVHRDGLLHGASSTPSYYFVHSYVFAPDDPRVVSGYTTYGERFATTVESGNIYGTQFHPEKSQRDGLALLNRFLEISRVAC
jgi:imidazole glycerol-phosphate synthase subunit HisH